MNQTIDLEAAKAAFFASGRTMLVIEHGEYVPPPARREPPPKAAKVRTKAEIRSDDRLKRMAYARNLARTMTCREAVAITGLSWSCLKRYAIDGNFRFQPDPQRGKGKLGKKLSDPVKDREKADQIIAYRNLCVSRDHAAKLMGISVKQLKRLLNDFEIDYPTTAERRAARNT